MPHSTPISPESELGVGDDWARRVSTGIAGGSRDALASLYQHRFDAMYRTVRERTGRDESFSLDCIQDAMLRVARGMPTCENVAALDAWLRRVVLTAALDRLRSERTRRSREERVSSDDLVAAHGLESLEEELAMLDDEDRSLLRLRFTRGLTLSQLAQHFGEAPKALDSRVRRALKRVRDRIRGEPAEKLP